MPSNDFKIEADDPLNMSHKSNKVEQPAQKSAKRPQSRPDDRKPKVRGNSSSSANNQTQDNLKAKNTKQENAFIDDSGGSGDEEYVEQFDDDDDETEQPVANISKPSMPLNPV